jgi:hypothetical protein
MKTNRFFSYLLLSLIILTSNRSFSQDTNIFREINTQVWEKFESAFKTNNPELLNSLHTSDILRIPAESKTLLFGKEYFASQNESFAWIKDNGYSTGMELRFIERINYEAHASERGIFKFTVIEPGDVKRVYFGKFHMILEKQSGTWKIAVDYDSNENGAITETDFNNAYDKWNLKPFLAEEK